MSNKIAKTIARQKEKYATQLAKDADLWTDTVPLELLKETITKPTSNSGWSRPDISKL